jgi:hypothetical protein
MKRILFFIFIISGILLFLNEIEAQTPDVYVYVDKASVSVGQSVHIKVVVKSYCALVDNHVVVDFGDGDSEILPCNFPPMCVDPALSSPFVCEGEWDHSYQDPGDYTLIAGAGVPGSPIGAQAQTIHVVALPTSVATATLNPLVATTTAQVLRNVANFIFLIAFSLALLMIIVGGFIILTSAGNPIRLKQGRDILLYTLLGLAIMMLSRGIIDLVYLALSVRR